MFKFWSSNSSNLEKGYNSRLLYLPAAAVVLGDLVFLVLHDIMNLNLYVTVWNTKIGYVTQESQQSNQQ